MRIALILAFLPMLLNAQLPVIPQLRAVLSDTLSESSALEYVSDTSLWSHNDSGDPGRIYQIDTSGTIRRILNLQNVSPYDTEDIAQDSQGNFYIGDFGNNSNDRTDLKIYKIPPPSSIIGDSVTPLIIAFSFADQTAFPPPANEQNFDCEALFHHNGMLYVFSKNRGTSSYCRMYKMPDTAGVYNIMPVDSFDTQWWITAADISPSGQQMLLFSEINMYLFSNFSGDNFFQGNVVHFTMSPYTQKEAVVFATDSLLYLTDEVLFNSGGKLYSIDLSAALTASVNSPQTAKTFQLIPNPVTDAVTIQTKENSFAWEILAADGRLVNSGFSATSSAHLTTELLLPGWYTVRIITASNQTASELLLRTK